MDSELIQEYQTSRREMMDLLNQLTALLNSSYTEFPTVQELLELVEKLRSLSFEFHSYYDEHTLGSLTSSLEM